jgi:hypothetical protein
MYSESFLFARSYPTDLDEYSLQMPTYNCKTSQTTGVTLNMGKKIVCEISGFKGGEYENGCLLGKVIVLIMEAASTSETSVNFYQTIWSKNLKDNHLKVCLCFVTYSQEHDSVKSD